MSRKNSAGSSITDLVGIMPRTKLCDGVPSVWHFPELGAETFLAGEMVCLSGTVGAAVGITKPGTDASGYGILGFAADSASGSTSSMKAVWIASPDVVFVGNVGHATSASAQTAASDLGQKYGLTSLSGRTYIDKGKAGQASTAMVRVIGLYEQDNHPCFYGRVLFTVFPDSCQLFSNWVLSSSLKNTVI